MTGTYVGTPADSDPSPGDLFLAPAGTSDIILFRAGPLTLSAEQNGFGAPVTIRHGNLRPGFESLTAFSIDPCPVIGGGPYAGLCASTPSDLTFLTTQILSPLGTPIFHFLAPGTQVTWPPGIVLALTYDGLAVRVAARAIHGRSAVTRFTIQ